MTRRPTAIGAIVALAIVALAFACARGPRSRSRLAPAGAIADPSLGSDDGTGILAQASARLMIEGGGAPARGDGYGGWGYGGSLYGGYGYGGSPYAGYTPQASTDRATRSLDYRIVNLADAGALVGTVTWPAAPRARRLKTPCGTIDNPTLRLGPRSEVGGAIVYLDKIERGRPFEILGQAVTLGGTVARRRCAMSPTAQVMLPVPATLALHNHDKADTYLVRPATGDPTPIELGGGDHRPVAIDRGVTMIGDAAGRAIPAWVVAFGHPYVTLTDDVGRFRIDNIAPGVYDLVIWHPPVVTGYRGDKPVFGAPIVVKRIEKIAPSTTRRLPPIALPAK